MELEVLKKETSKGTYYTIVGSKTKVNLYGRELPNLKKTLQTNKKGKVFHAQISSLDWQEWEKIQFDNLPQYLKKSFLEFENWITSEL